MNPEPLPPDLRDLEGQVAQRRCPTPSDDFRAQVLGAMTNEFAPPSVKGAWRWRLVWQSAAAILVLNLGMSVANGVRFQRLTPPLSAGEPRAEVTGAEERFQAVAARALANVTPAPDGSGLSQHLFSTEEEGRWVMP
jgi:hypothetical protein